MYNCVTVTKWVGHSNDPERGTMSAATRRWVRITRRRMGRAAVGPAILGAGFGGLFYYDDLVEARQEAQEAAKRFRQEPRQIPFDWGWLLLNAATWSAIVVACHSIGSVLNAAIAWLRKPFSLRA